MEGSERRDDIVDSGEVVAKESGSRRRGSSDGCRKEEVFVVIGCFLVWEICTTRC